MPKCNSCCMLLLHFGTRAYLFLPDKGSCYIFSTQSNCCEFLASYSVILYSDIQPYFKTPVCGAPFSYVNVYSFFFFVLFCISYFIEQCKLPTIEHTLFSDTVNQWNIIGNKFTMFWKCSSSITTTYFNQSIKIVQHYKISFHSS